MTNREQLYENYEDALFAILMDDLAEAEGERLLELNQQLQNDPDAAVPDEVRQRCIAVINREFAKKKRAASVQHAKKVLKILPWAVVIAMALMAVAFAAFPAFRASVLNVLKINANDNTTWSFNSSSKAVNNGLSFSIDLPEVFEVKDISISPDAETVDYQSTMNTNDIISITVFFGTNTVVGINNENCDLYSTIEIQGHLADFCIKDLKTWITWADSSIPYICTIESTNVDSNEIIEIANSFSLHR